MSIIDSRLVILDGLSSWKSTVLLFVAELVRRSA